ncbi:hypothetical protein HD554DRAFT_2040722 [Boletus coccyginus]|nr:hypothetical protein HD554DRAFT_2040722 [Boletus coccyginus]
MEGKEDPMGPGWYQFLRSEKSSRFISSETQGISVTLPLLKSGGRGEECLLTGGGVVISVLVRGIMDHWLECAVDLNMFGGILVTERAAILGVVDMNVLVGGTLEAAEIKLALVGLGRQGRTSWQRGDGRECWHCREDSGDDSSKSGKSGDFFGGCAKRSSEINIPINMGSSPFFLLESALLMIMGELCWEGDEAIKEWSCSPVRESVEGKERKWSLKDHSIEEVPYMEWKCGLDIQDNGRSVDNVDGDGRDW